MENEALKEPSRLNKVPPCWEVSQIGELFQKAKANRLECLSYYLECGKRLTSVKDSLPHGAWLSWLAANEIILGFGERTAQFMIRAATRNAKLASDLDDSGALTISRQLWGHSVDNHRALGTSENDWHTPPEYIEAAREVMGGIDLDPASSVAAQAKVKAKTFYSAQEDGLSKIWSGRVWLNPPYSQPFIVQFIEKLVDEQCANVSQAILLTHNYTDTAWFHYAEKAASLICFTRGRIHFVNTNGETAQPTQGQAFFYFGSNMEKFRNVFSRFGFISCDFEVHKNRADRDP